MSTITLLQHEERDVGGKGGCGQPAIVMEEECALSRLHHLLRTLQECHRRVQVVDHALCAQTQKEHHSLQNHQTTIKPGLRNQTEGDHDHQEQARQDPGPQEQTKEDHELQKQISEDHNLEEQTREDHDLQEETREKYDLQKEINKDYEVQEQTKQDHEFHEQTRQDHNLQVQSLQDHDFQKQTSQGHEFQEQTSQDHNHQEKSRQDHCLQEQTWQDNNLQKQNRQNHDLRTHIKEEHDLRTQIREDHDLQTQIREDHDLQTQIREDNDLQKQMRRDHNVQNQAGEDHDLQKGMSKVHDLHNQTGKDHELQNQVRLNLDLQVQSEESHNLQKQFEEDYSFRDVAKKDSDLHNQDGDHIQTTLDHNSHHDLSIDHHRQVEEDLWNQARAVHDYGNQGERYHNFQNRNELDHYLQNQTTGDHNSQYQGGEEFYTHRITTSTRKINYIESTQNQQRRCLVRQEELDGDDLHPRDTSSDPSITTELLYTSTNPNIGENFTVQSINSPTNQKQHQQPHIAVANHSKEINRDKVSEENQVIHPKVDNLEQIAKQNLSCEGTASFEETHMRSKPSLMHHMGYTKEGNIVKCDKTPPETVEAAQSVDVVWEALETLRAYFLSLHSTLINSPNLTHSLELSHLLDKSSEINMWANYPSKKLCGEQCNHAFCEDDTTMLHCTANERTVHHRDTFLQQPQSCRQRGHTKRSTPLSSPGLKEKVKTTLGTLPQGQTELGTQRGTLTSHGGTFIRSWRESLGCAAVALLMLFVLLFLACWLLVVIPIVTISVRTSGGLPAF